MNCCKTFTIGITVPTYYARVAGYGTTEPLFSRPAADPSAYPEWDGVFLPDGNVGVATLPPFYNPNVSLQGGQIYEGRLVNYFNTTWVFSIAIWPANGGNNFGLVWKGQFSGPASNPAGVYTVFGSGSDTRPYITIETP